MKKIEPKKGITRNSFKIWGKIGAKKSIKKRLGKLSKKQRSLYMSKVRKGKSQKEIKCDHILSTIICDDKTSCLKCGKVFKTGIKYLDEAVDIMK